MQNFFDYHVKKNARMASSGWLSNTCLTLLASTEEWALMANDLKDSQPLVSYGDRLRLEEETQNQLRVPN